MADKKLTSLGEHTATNNNDLMYIVASNVSKFIRLSTLKALFGEKNKDTYLDLGGANEVTAAQVKLAVEKAHVQDTDLGTNSDSFTIGFDEFEENIYLYFGEAGPGIRLNVSVSPSVLEWSNDGVVWQEFGTGSGEEHFKGLYLSEAALEIAHPTSIPGDYAIVDGGSGADAQIYIWDDDDSNWVLSSGTTTIVPDASTTVKGLVEKATPGEADAGTSIGGTGAELFLGPAEAKTLLDDKLSLGGGTISGGGYEVELIPGYTIIRDDSGNEITTSGTTIQFNDGTYSTELYAPFRVANTVIEMPTGSGRLALLDDIPEEASDISNTPAGSIAATTVQAAINELDTEKEPVFSKNTGFNKNFGTTAGTVVEGNDSRLVGNAIFMYQNFI